VRPLQHLEGVALALVRLFREPVLLARRLVHEAPHRAVAVLLVRLELQLALGVESLEPRVGRPQLRAQVVEEPPVLLEVRRRVVRLGERAQQVAVPGGRILDLGRDVGHGGESVATSQTSREMQHKRVSGYRETEK